MILCKRSYLTTVVNSIDLCLDLGQPGWVDDGQRLNPELGAGQGEFNLRGDDLHRDLAVLFQTLPNLMTVAPKGLKNDR
jgi:hypothetical protein